ncbi:MAG: HAD family hydrolase [Myxococcota bacterium]
MPTPTVFLFDIDGTILNAHGAGRRAMESAFEAVCPGKVDAMGRVKFSGMTDPGIARAALREAGESEDDASIEAVVRGYLQRIEAQLRDGSATHLLEGAVAAIDVAHAHPAGAVGLGTGNHVDGARLKLAAVGLWDRFGFGGFGSDAEDRAQMLAIGRDRGLAVLQRREARVLVVGDTPRDVAAAHAIGAVCLAVTTGSYDRAALEAAGADRVVDRLDAPESLEILRA